MAATADIRIPGPRDLVIPGDALEWQFVRASGPGGQHVNRTSSKAVLRFDAAHSPHLPDDVRSRLIQREKARLTRDGALVITSQRHRDQPRNVADCLEKLETLLRAALVAPLPRRGSKTPVAARGQRLEEKQRRSRTKQLRRPTDSRRGED